MLATSTFAEASCAGQRTRDFGETRKRLIQTTSARPPVMEAHGKWAMLTRWPAHGARASETGCALPALQRAA